MTEQGNAPGPLDAMAAAPDHHRILLENDRVRVLDTRLAPGDTAPLHEHGWHAALHVLSWSGFVCNVGACDLHVIAIELKN